MIPADGRLRGRVGLITGAASGIGGAGAELFAAHGAALVLVDTDAAAGERTAAAITAGGGRAVFVPGDAASAGDISHAVSAAVNTFGKLDLLWANAGIGVTKTVPEMTVEEWTRVLDVNLTGAFLCCREALQIMKPQKSGRIINIGSISSITPRANGAAYAATKLALEGLTRSIALDYREFNIGASIIHLGATASSWMKVKPEEATGPEYHLQLDDVGRLATFMASLPLEANMFETTILPIQQRSFIGRG